jgi:peroxiredoxin
MKRHTQAYWATLGWLALAVGATSARAAGEAKLRRAPDFELADYTGKKFSLESFRGKVVLLEFFRSGCPTCQQEAPFLEKLYQDYKGKGVVIVGISHEQGGAEAVRLYAKKYAITFPLLLGDLEVAVRYLGITPANPRFDIPHYFVIDRQGYLVRDFLVGRDAEFARDEQHALKHALDNALVAPAPASSPSAQPQP